jgi:hypothetical protein
VNVSGRVPDAQGPSPLDVAMSALRDIRQAIWTDKHGIERIDVGCIKEALESVFGSAAETKGEQGV